MGQNSSQVQVNGTCEEKFQPVKEKLEQMLQKGKEDNVQLCVYVDGKCVVDLYGTAIGDTDYNADTIQNVYSSGKTLECIVMGMLYDKGLFKFEDKISKHWPEFGQNEKEDLQICDVLRHESGLSYFTESLPTIKDAWTENIKQNKVGQLIEKQSPHFPNYEGSDSRTDYHALTRGMVVNEIVRRIDPQGRTMGEIIREDANIEGIYVGLKDEEMKNIATVAPPSTMFLYKDSLTPTWAGKRLGFTAPQLYNLIQFISKAFKATGDKADFCLEMLGKGHDLVTPANLKDFQKSEVSSCFSNASARGLAKLASIMANKGESLMSNEAWEELHTEPKMATLFQFPDGDVRSRFTKGGVNCFNAFENMNPLESHGMYKNRDGYYGWFGFGGSVFQWHSELRIGFAFVPTCLQTLDLTNARGAALQQIVKECCKNSKA